MTQYTAMISARDAHALTELLRDTGMAEPRIWTATDGDTCRYVAPLTAPQVARLRELADDTDRHIDFELTEVPEP